MYEKCIKRMLDIVLALCGLPLLALILIVFAPIVYFTDKGPVFYNAERLGKNGKSFKMFKLRSMYVNAPDIRLKDGSTYNAADDPRVTPVGRFLRKTSLDEAPQILNVLLGDMSVVGPRPTLATIDYNNIVGVRKIRYQVRPGITGYTQAYYRNSITQQEKFVFDARYVENLGFMLDIKIFVRTVQIVLLRKNVYSKANASTKPHAKVTNT